MRKIINWINASNKNKIITGITLATLLVLSIGIGVTWNLKNKTSGTTTEGDAYTEELESDDQISSDTVAIRITADKNTDFGVPVDSGFLLSCDETVELTKDLIQEQLEIEPKLDYVVEQVSQVSYAIKFTSKLPVNSILKMKYQYGEENYGYAFQTEEPFWIRSVYPADASKEVPVNAGIEFTFSRGVNVQIQDFVTFEPEIEGNWTVKENKAIFIPKIPMNEMTTYTVSIKSGYTVNDEVLETKTIQFTTSRDWDNTFGIIGPKVKRLDAQGKQVLFLSGLIDKTSTTMQIYRIDQNQEEILRYVSRNEIIKQIKATQTGDFELSMEASIVTNNEYYTSRLQLNENLPKGLYYIAPDIGTGNEGTFVQVSSYYAYMTNDPDQMLMWVQGEGSLNGSVFVDDMKIGNLDANGSGLFDIFMEQNEQSIVRVELTSETLYFPVTPNLDYENPREKYYAFLTTDRQLYLPTDTIQINGFIQNRIGIKDYDTVEVQLVYDEKVIDSKVASVSKIGTYSTSFDIQEFNNDYLSIHTLVNGEIISFYSVNVFEFEKPKYVLSSELDKEWLRQGEQVQWSGKLAYYSGTPVSDASVSLDWDQWNGVSVTQPDDGTPMSSVILDATDGVFEKSFELASDLPVWRPIWVNISSRNNNLDNYYLYTNNNIFLFPSDRMIEAQIQKESNETGILGIDCHTVDPTLIQHNISDPDEFRGTAVSGMELDISIIETYYEPIFVRQEYNEIYKEAYDVYRYEEHRTEFLSMSLTTDENGRISLPVEGMLKDRYYIIYINGVDSKGHSITEELYYGSYGYPQDNVSEPIYSLIQNKEDDQYDVAYGQSVEVELLKDNQSIEEQPGDKLLLIERHDGIKAYKILDTTKYRLEFDSSYMPNTEIRGVYYTGSYMKASREMATNLWVRVSSRELNIDVQYDKTTYRPGEQVNYTIEVTDRSGVPIQADVNVSVVDEAIFAVVESFKNPISDILDYIYDQHILSEYVFANNDDNQWGGAESGGEGGADGIRSDFKNTAYFKTVTTDEEGRLTGSFVLPDNITKWRATVTAFSADVQASGIKTQVISKLPLFVDTVMEETFLVGDQIQIFAKAAGDFDYLDQMIQLTIDLKDQSGKVLNQLDESVDFGKETIFDIGKLPLGTYTLEFKVRQGSLSDTMIRNFEVVDSREKFELVQTENLTKETEFIHNQNYVSIEIMNQEAREELQAIEALTYSRSERTENSMVQLFTRYYIDQTFNPDIRKAKEDLATWMEKNDLSTQWILGANNLVIPLQNAEGDAFVSALLLNIGLTDYLKVDNYGQWDYLKAAMWEIVDKNYATSLDYASALWGLSEMGEPVLLTVNKAIEAMEDMESYEAQLCLIQALTEMGETTRAKALLVEFLDQQQIDPEALMLNPGIPLSTNSMDVEKEENLRASLLSLTSELNLWSWADALYRSIQENRSSNARESYRTPEPELFYYLTHKPQPVLDAKLMYELKGQSYEMILNFENMLQLTLTPEETDSLKIVDIQGVLTVQKTFIGTARQVDPGTNVVITRSYSNKKNSKANIHVGDEVLVTFTVDSEMLINGFEIQDSLPAGLTYLETVESNTGYVYGDPKGNAVDLQYYVFRKLGEVTTHRTFSYVALATLPGTYLAESTLVYMPELKESSVGEEAWITIREK